MGQLCVGVQVLSRLRFIILQGWQVRGGKDSGAAVSGDIAAFEEPVVDK